MIRPVAPIPKGRVHSIATCDTAGPGSRYVILTQGCPLHCQYCHIPDARDPWGGTEVTVEELMADIQDHRADLTDSGGGVTISGGEPLLQPEFVGEILRRCQAVGIHTALDTSGFPNFEASKPVLEHTDLVLLDLKSFDPEIYHQVTGVAIEPTLRFACYLSAMQYPSWIRFALVPGLTDDWANVVGIASFVSALDGVERVEVLPFQKTGEDKWKELGLHYTLSETKTPTPEQVEDVKNLLREHDLSVE